MAGTIICNYSLFNPETQTTTSLSEPYDFTVDNSQIIYEFNTDLTFNEFEKIELSKNHVCQLKKSNKKPEEYYYAENLFNIATEPFIEGEKMAAINAYNTNILIPEITRNNDSYIFELSTLTNNLLYPEGVINSIPLTFIAEEPNVNIVLNKSLQESIYSLKYRIFSNSVWTEWKQYICRNCNFIRKYSETNYNLKILTIHYQFQLLIMYNLQ